MSHGTIALLFAGSALLALALVVPMVRRARAAGELDSSAVLAFAAGLLFSLPSILEAITGELQRRTDAFGDLIVIDPSWFHRVDELDLVLLVGLVGLLVSRRAAAGGLCVNVPGILALALWAIAQLASGLQGAQLVTTRGLVLLACLVAATVLPRGRGAAVGVGLFGVFLAAAGGLLSLFRYDVAFVVPCEGACTPPGFTGVLSNENLLGIALAASLPFAYLGFRGRARFWLCVYLVAMAICTGSRTAGAGALLTLAAMLIVRPGLDGPRRPLWRGAVAWTFLAGAVASSIYIIRHHWSPSALTTRPELWGVAWTYIHRSRWFGYGPEKWTTLYTKASQITLAAQRSTHNLWLDLLFAAGGVGVVLFIGVALTAIVTAGRARNGVVVILASILVLGTTEGVWLIGTFDIFSFSLLAFLLTSEAPAKPVPSVRPAASVVRPRPRRITRETLPET